MTLLTTRYLYKAPFTLDALALTLPAQADTHVNKAPFRGILTRVDEPSTRPPNGSNGHRVLIPRAVAEEALPSLEGMPIDFSDSMKDHDKKQIVGILEGGKIEGKDLVVTGYLLEKNWPDEVAEIRRRRDELGMSYEISDCDIINQNSLIWELSHFIFTGAAILKKDAAAYAKTAIAANMATLEDELTALYLERLTRQVNRLVATHQRRRPRRWPTPY